MFYLIPICSIFLLVVFNRLLTKAKLLLVLNSIFLSESFALLFFFDKYPTHYSIPVFFLSLYYFLVSSKSLVVSESSNLIPKSIQRYFRYAATSILIFVFVYESLGDRNLSTTGVLFIFLSILLWYFNEIPKQYSDERDFFLVFISIIIAFLILPHFLHKILFDSIGSSSSDGWIKSDILIYYFLGKPLSIILQIMGYNVFSEGVYIQFEDLETHRLVTVEIAESCTGIASFQIFTCFLISYLIVFRRTFDYISIYYFLLGLIIGYLANLFRMITIVLSGHYYGIDVMQWVHQYVGWLIFTIWIFLFYIVMDNTINAKTTNLDIVDEDVT